MPLTNAYLQRMKKEIRASDRKEADLTSDTPFNSTSFESYGMNSLALIDTTNDNLFAIGGVVPQKEGAITWCLCTEQVEKEPLKFLRFSKLLLKQWLDQYTFLYNIAMVSNSFHYKWLKWLGATFKGKPIQLEDELFLYFIIKR